MYCDNQNSLPICTIINAKCKGGGHGSDPEAGANCSFFSSSLLFHLCHSSHLAELSEPEAKVTIINETDKLMLFCIGLWVTWWYFNGTWLRATSQLLSAATIPPIHRPLFDEDAPKQDERNDKSTVLIYVLQLLFLCQHLQGALGGLVF